jgi:hypothetical protein
MTVAQSSFQNCGALEKSCGTTTSNTIFERNEHRATFFLK